MTGQTTVLVTGGMGRLGRALVEDLEARGVRPLVTSRSPEKVDHFNHEMERRGRCCRAMVLRFETRDEVKAAALRAVDEFGAIDGLVNNAYAALDFRPLGEIPWEHWAEAAKVALAGAETLSSALVDLRDGSHIASIVNVSSIYGVRAPNFSIYDKGQNPSPVYYGAIKAGMLALTRYLAVSWGEIGVRVNAVAPGGVSGSQTGTFRQAYAASTPNRRMVEGDEVAAAVWFLISGESRGITGTTLVVDGGRTVW